jgi:hypothetical protein
MKKFNLVLCFKLKESEVGRKEGRKEGRKKRKEKGTVRRRKVVKMKTSECGMEIRKKVLLAEYQTAFSLKQSLTIRRVKQNL